MTAQVVCALADVPEVGALRVEAVAVDGSDIEVAVVRDENGTLHAVSDICSHGQVSLSEGDVVGSTIECWLHGSTFDLASGMPQSLPATQPIPVYPVSVVDGNVLVDVDAPVPTGAAGDLKES